MLTVTILNADRAPIHTTTTFTVDRYDHYADGGPNSASLTATGTPEGLDAMRRWLGYYVIIYNGNGRAVWWGKITGTSAPFDKLEIGAGLDETFNRVQVLYSLDSANFATAWVEHARSVAAFGRKELKHSLGEVSAEQADAAAMTVLAKVSKARQDVGFGSGAATLRCQGIWKLFDWTYYENPAGKHTYEGFATTEQPIGWGVTASDIGFVDRAVHKIAGSLGELRSDDTFRVTGSSAGNNGVYIVSGGASKPAAYTATSISFAPGDDIIDSNNNLGFVRSGVFVHVSGSALNSRYHLIDAVSRASIEVSTTVTGAILAETAGPSITIQMGSSMSIVQDVFPEIPAASITLAGISRLRYKFIIPALPNWTAAEIWIKAAKVGDPADNLRIAIYANSGGNLGALIEAITITGANLTHDNQWVKSVMLNTALLTATTPYWIVIERTGANSTENYYLVGIDEDLGDPDGLMFLWDGVAWVSRAASMPFQIWGATYTTAQISAILGNEGQFLTGYDIRVATGVLSRQWRDGAQTALLELRDLLEAGTSAGGAVIATINEAWRCVVDAMPSSALPPYRLNRDGTFSTALGSPLEEGVLPVGQWCEVDGIEGDGDDLIPVSPFLIGYMAWSKGRIVDFKPYGSTSVWDIPALLQG